MRHADQIMGIAEFHTVRSCDFSLGAQKQKQEAGVRVGIIVSKLFAARESFATPGLNGQMSLRMARIPGEEVRRLFRSNQRRLLSPHSGDLSQM